MLYIVHIRIDRPIADDWERWMRDVHVPDVVETGCFATAVMARDESSDDDQRVGFRIIYRAHSDQAYERYVAEHADRLQREHTERYRGRFDASRDLLDVVDHW